MLEDLRFSALFAFKYSPRPGTAAPRLGPPVDDAVASRRLQTMNDVQNAIQRELNTALVGESFEVLVTGWGKQPGALSGRTSCHRIVHFPAGEEPPAIGSLCSVTVEQAFPHSLLGQRTTAPAVAV